MVFDSDSDRELFQIGSMIEEVSQHRVEIPHQFLLIFTHQIYPDDDAPGIAEQAGDDFLNSIGLHPLQDVRASIMFTFHALFTLSC